jgi:hypothetical protein
MRPSLTKILQQQLAPLIKIHEGSSLGLMRQQTGF